MHKESYKTVNNAVKNDLSESTLNDRACFVERIIVNAIGNSCVFSIKDDTVVKVTGSLANTELPHAAELGLNIETSLKVEMTGSAAGNVLVIYKT